MNCPLDNTTLAMVERQGVEFVYCPTCRGVWLDRGELDKIIERANHEAESGIADAPRHEDHERAGYSGKPHKKRRGSFLGEMFEFGG